MRQALLVLHTIVLTISQAVGFTLVCLLGMAGIDAFASVYPRIAGYGFLGLLIGIGLFCWGRDNYEELASDQRTKDKRKRLDALRKDDDDDDMPPTGQAVNGPADGLWA